MENKTKKKLKRRGEEMYLKYFFNSNEIINTIIEQYDNNKIINNDMCEVIFDLPISYKEQIYELILYYPNKLKEIKYIDENKIKELYKIYGETIDIMKSSNSIRNVRGKLYSSVSTRARKFDIECNICSEDIILVKNCPYLDSPISYGEKIAIPKSPSVDRIDSTKGYVKGNIQVMSLLANQMKSSANETELLTFANNIIKLHG